MHILNAAFKCWKSELFQNMFSAWIKCYLAQTYTKANSILILFENSYLQNNMQWYF